MQKKITIIISLLICSVATFSQNKIVGKWLSEDKEAIISIYKQNEKFYGKLTWLKNPKDKNGKYLTDTENPNAKLRNKPLVGLEILNNFYFKDDEWKDGKIYDPKDGKTYICSMWLTDKNELKVRGYWGVFYSTVVWTSVK